MWWIGKSAGAVFDNYDKSISTGNLNRAMPAALKSTDIPPRRHAAKKATILNRSNKKKETIFRKLARLLGEIEEETPDDIDKQIEAEVNKIDEATHSGVDGIAILSGEWGGKGDVIHFMDLGPIYEAIGSRSGRLYAGTKLVCKKVFERHVVSGAGRAELRGEQLIMRFYAMSAQKGFILAAKIINDIGTQVLGERFYTIEIPDILVSVDAGDLALEDGTLSLDKIPEAAEKFVGDWFTAGEPPEDLPAWVKLLWKKQREVQNLFKTITARKKDPIAKDPGAPRLKSAWVKRQFDERRSSRIPYQGVNKRKGVDRRGRGF